MKININAIRSKIIGGPISQVCWKDLPGHLWNQSVKTDIFMMSSSLAYTTILSIIPALAVSFAVFQAFGGMQKVYSKIEPMILENLAQGASQDVIQTLHKFIENAHAGAIGIGGFIGLVVTTMGLLSTAEGAVNKVWQTKVKRTFFERFSSYWLFITLGPLAFSILVGAATSAHMPLYKILPSGTGIFLITIGIFFSVYKWVPRAPVKTEFALFSALIAAVFWNLAGAGYTLYAKSVLTYHTIYGSLGAIPVLLLWIYIIWVIVLGGVALTVALHQSIE